MLDKEDFEQLSKDGFSFEALVSHLFEAMGYRVVEKPATGTDHGRDVIVERKIDDPFGSKIERVVVQCKHKAHGKKPVYESELGAWENTFTKHRAQCYLLVTSSIVSEGLNKAFNSFNENNGQNRQASFWDVYDLIKFLNEYPDVKNVFFKDNTFSFKLDLDKQGWAAIFSDEVSPSIKNALHPLLSLRKKQAGRLYKEFTYQNGESYLDFISRHGIAPGAPLNSEQMPFFLCVVGGPKEIPFSFTASLESKYAVGRICFADPKLYLQYAQSIVDFEIKDQPYERKMTILSASHPDDPTMNLCYDNLIKPLPELINEALNKWKIKIVTGLSATKEVFKKTLNTKTGGNLIFLAAHGLSHKDKRLQGSLVTSDWQPGKKLNESMFFSIDDVPDSANVKGKIFFVFGCFTAGQSNDYGPSDNPKAGLSTAEDTSSYISSLSQELLSHKNGSALAFIGHTGFAFEQSFMWKGNSQPHTIAEVLKSLLMGLPAGLAMQAISNKSQELNLCLQEMRRNKASAEDIFYLSKALEDARSYVLLGDPLARFI